MFKFIAGQSPTVGFVWLDIKNPDYCGLDDPVCGIKVLRDTARRILEPKGIRVMYGFYGDILDGKAYPLLRDGLTQYEAINVDGPTSDVAAAFTDGPGGKGQKVMSYGQFDIKVGFGDCKNDGGRCAELKKGAGSGEYGKVFGWTVLDGRKKEVDQLLGETQVDGLIYGYSFADYDEGAKKAQVDMKKWIEQNPEKRYVATGGTLPW